MIKTLLKWYYSFIYGKDEGTVEGLSGIDFRILSKAIFEGRNGIGYDPHLHTPVLAFFGLHKRSVTRLQRLGFIENMAPPTWVVPWDWYKITESGLKTWHSYRINEFGNADLTKPFYNNEGH